jgi:hypothetical protein
MTKMKLDDNKGDPEIRMKRQWATPASASNRHDLPACYGCDGTNTFLQGKDSSPHQGQATAAVREKGARV